MQAYFGWAKPCSCSYCCSRHLWFYDSGRLGRVEIVTLTVGARAKEGKFQRGAFTSKLCAQRKRPHCRLEAFLQTLFTWLENDRWSSGVTPKSVISGFRSNTVSLITMCKSLCQFLGPRLITWPSKGSRLQNSPYFCVFKFARTVKQKVWGEAENGERDWGDTLKWVEVAVRRQSLCLLLEKGESRKSRTLQIIVECEAVVSKNKSAILKSGWIKAENVIVSLTSKRWNVTKVGRSSEKTNFSLS